MLSTKKGWAAAIMLGFVFAGCGEDEGEGEQGVTEKSVFELTEDDFQDQLEFTVSGEELSNSPTMAVDPVQVEQGDVLKFSASGTVDTDSGSFDPNGGEGIAGTSYLLTNRHVFRLYGIIGDHVFSIGADNVVLAPESGELQVVMNYCAEEPLHEADDGIPQPDCDFDGEYQVELHQNLNPDVQIAGKPPLWDNTVESAEDVVVDASEDWQSTQVSVKRGRKVYVDAQGLFEQNDQEFDADGGLSVGGTSYLLPNRPVMRLFGRVDGAVVDIGSSGAFLAPAEGELELAVNHAGDASGQLDVELEIGVIPAVGLQSVDADELETSGELDMEADGTWHSSEVEVEKGEPIAFSASGEAEQNGTSYSPYGDPGWGGTLYALTNRPIFALYGRVGDQVFFVGESNAVLADDSGTLEFLVNTVADCDVCGDCPAPDDQDGEDEISQECSHCDQCDISGSYEVEFSAP